MPSPSASSSSSRCSCSPRRAGLFRLQEAKKWERITPSGLRGKTAGIVGLGHIGREIARLSKAFGMRVVATRRGAKHVGTMRYVDAVYPAARLPELLAESDFVVLSLPYTPETEKIIGEKELGMMKPSAFLINIARGGVVDEEALIRALEEKRIAGAGLDVFSIEPLPADSRLWGMKNVIVSPHMSGNMDDYIERATDLFVRNLGRYLEGKRMLTVVDKKKGY
jgi:phosphoglycerate dehydrogenase-like enzyme